MQIKIAVMLRWQLLLLVNALILACLGKILQVGDRKKHLLNYNQNGDWQPHFGYRKGHYAYEHEHRNRSGSTPVPGTPLDDYVVRIMAGGKLICSGIIVNKQEVLTLTVCVMDAPLASISLQLLDGSVYNATSNRPGKRYTTQYGVPLLTLIKLGAELGEQFAKPAPICRHHIKSTDQVQLWRWNSRNTYLKKSRVAQIMADECRRKIMDTEGTIITDYTSCIVNIRKTNGCVRNFGLPYVYEDSFCGMNLLGHNCPSPTDADVYLRLIDEKRFISEKLNLVRLSGIDKEIF